MMMIKFCWSANTDFWRARDCVRCMCVCVLSSNQKMVIYLKVTYVSRDICTKKNNNNENDKMSFFPPTDTIYSNIRVFMCRIPWDNGNYECPAYLASLIWLFLRWEVRRRTTIKKRVASSICLKQRTVLV